MKIEYFSPRQCWRVRWTQDGKQVAKYFKSRTDAHVTYVHVLPEAQIRASSLLPDLEDEGDKDDFQKWLRSKNL